jgi:phosphoglycerate kinase
MMPKQSVRDVEVRGRRVFVRVDFNVPLRGNRIEDDTRILASLPTIRLLVERGASVILASHLGRPKARREEEYSLAPVAARLAELLARPVAFSLDCVGDAVREQVKSLRPGEVLLLENVRFHAGEEANDLEFARELAALADVYVNDAFGAAHRAHASTVGVPALVQPAVAGLLMEKELDYLGRVLAHPERPFYALLGGAKVSDKIGVLSHLLDIADGVLVAGGMAYTFLRAMGRRVGASLVEEDKLDVAKKVLIRSIEIGVPLYLPIDHVLADRFAADAAVRTAYRDLIPHGWQALDVGPNTVAMYTEILARARTVVWNGPVGVYEFDAFAKGTMAFARALADLNATTIIGGGDCAAAVHKAGVADRMTHISTGGGASLEFLEGKALPGVVALSERTPATSGPPG